MIYLDTHVIVWLYAGEFGNLSKTTKDFINRNDIAISPIVRLELQYLFQVERITADSKTIIDDLVKRIGLVICDKGFNAIVAQAIDFPWTRDPLDRLIVANAALDQNILLTKDQNILKNYQYATW